MSTSSPSIAFASSWPRQRAPALEVLAGILVLAAIPYLWPQAFPWAIKYPAALVVPLADWVRDGLMWLVRLELYTGEDGVPVTMRDMTRAVAGIMKWPLGLSDGLLATGFELGGLTVPPLSWVGITCAVAAWGWALGGRGLALLGLVACLYIAAFGQWQNAMITVSQIVIVVPLGTALGLALGIAAWRSARVRAFVVPTLDLMQTIPTFAYLVPILFLIGVGPVAGGIATLIYAMPPMVRVTMLALDHLPPELQEAARMVGATPRQVLWRVLIPAAGPSLMVGVNQVIMLSLNMVIIAALVGGGGLGFVVISALRQANGLGPGLEAGLAVVAIAIVLDRYSQAAARLTPAHDPAVRRQRRQLLWLGVAALVLFTLLALAVPELGRLPRDWRVTTGPFWEVVIDFVTRTMFDTTEAIRVFLILNILRPTKEFLIGFPWPAFLALGALAGWRVGGWRLALGIVGLLGFIPLTGLWVKGMTTIYLCGISALFAVLLGLPLGLLAASSERWHRALGAVCDTLQTLPSFVYLLPVVMLFRVGDVSAMIAVVAYAIVPAIRYTDYGLRRVPQDLVEASLMAGSTRRQTLWKVKLPLALPEIMLGINQVIMMALSMLVITSLVGTDDLGKQVQMAITKVEPGMGLVAGFAIAFLGIASDRLLAAWAARRKRELGLT
ncbi:ABC transporter permease [Zavarzinia sp. CC-PAN008]|uniref:ABC transporter permease n=1 Tax=Zavarzinia sp. CC-PAN008 TaxID=3243332 RepID=UPI003F7498C7